MIYPQLNEINFNSLFYPDTVNCRMPNSNHFFTRRSGKQYLFYTNGKLTEYILYASGTNKYYFANNSFSLTINFKIRTSDNFFYGNRKASGANAHWQIGTLTGGLVRISLNDSAGNLIIYTTGAIPGDRFYTLSFTINRTTNELKYYLDFKLIATIGTAFTGNIPVVNDTAFLFGSGIDSGLCYNCFVISGKCLSDDETFLLHKYIKEQRNLVSLINA